MAQKTALYDLQGNFVMYGNTLQAFTYLREVLGKGVVLKVSHLSIAQITSLNLQQARQLAKSYIVKD